MLVATTLNKKLGEEISSRLMPLEDWRRRRTDSFSYDSRFKSNKALCRIRISHATLSIFLMRSGTGEGSRMAINLELRWMERNLLNGTSRRPAKNCSNSRREWKWHHPFISELKVILSQMQNLIYCRGNRSALCVKYKEDPLDNLVDNLLTLSTSFKFLKQTSVSSNFLW